MRVAIIGSRELKVKIEKYLPKNISLIISGGARGIDTLAEQYADKKRVEKLIFLPDYKKYGKAAPLIRNKQIVNHADLVIAFWNGLSRGTKFTMDYAKRIGKKIIVYEFFDKELKKLLKKSKTMKKTKRLAEREILAGGYDFYEKLMDEHYPGYLERKYKKSKNWK